MKDRRSLLLILVALTVGAFPQNTAGTGSHARIVRISYLQGTVQYNGAPAVMNSPVTEGSRLVTGTDGVAEVEFEDQSAIRLASETQVSFAQLTRLSNGEAMTRVDVEGGEAEFLIPNSSAGSFAVNVRGKNVLFTEAGRFRILSTHATPLPPQPGQNRPGPGTPLEIAAWKGEAEVRDLESGKAVTVKARETLALNPENLGQYNIENSVLADDLDRWSEQRDRDLRTNYVATNTYNNTVQEYAQNYQTGGYGSGYVASGVYPYDLYGYNGFGCGYGFAGFAGFGQPFWFGAPGFCGSSGFLFNPFFFSPPVIVVVAPPIRPRRPPLPIHPPTVAGVAKPGTANTVARPGFRSFRDQGEGQPGPERQGIRPGASTQNSIIDTAGTGSTMPGQHPGGGNVPLLTRSGPQHSAAPAARPPARSFSGPRGPSPGSFSHSSAPARSPGAHR